MIHLLVVETFVERAAGGEVVVRSFVDDVTVVEYKDLCRISYGAKTVGND